MPEQVTAFLDSKGYMWRTNAEALAADCQYLLGEVCRPDFPSIVQNADKVIEILQAYRKAQTA